MKTTVEVVVKKLVELGLEGVTLNYNLEEGMFFYDLNTQAKSHLHLYEDGLARMRYNSEMLNLDQPLEGAVEDVYFMFRGCLRGRYYCNPTWDRVRCSLRNSDNLEG